MLSYNITYQGGHQHHVAEVRPLDLRRLAFGFRLATVRFDPWISDAGPTHPPVSRRHHRPNKKINGKTYEELTRLARDYAGSNCRKFQNCLKIPELLLLNSRSFKLFKGSCMYFEPAQSLASPVNSSYIKRNLKTYKKYKLKDKHNKIKKTM